MRLLAFFITWCMFLQSYIYKRVQCSHKQVSSRYIDHHIYFTQDSLLSNKSPTQKTSLLWQLPTIKNKRFKRNLDKFPSTNVPEVLLVTNPEVIPDRNPKVIPASNPVVPTSDQFSSSIDYHVLVVMRNYSGDFTSRRDYVIRHFADIQSRLDLSSTSRASYLTKQAPNTPVVNEDIDTDDSADIEIPASLGKPTVRVRLAFAAAPFETDNIRLCDIVTTDRLQAVISLTHDSLVHKYPVVASFDRQYGYDVQRRLEVMSSYMSLPMFAYETVVPNGMYIASAPLASDLAELICRFCIRHGWSELAMISQNNQHDRSFSKTVRQWNSKGKGLRLLADIQLGEDWMSSDWMPSVRSYLRESRAATVLVRLEADASIRLFRSLSTRMKSDRLWILTGGAATVDKRMLKVYPYGCIRLIQQQSEHHLEHQIIRVLRSLQKTVNRPSMSTILSKQTRVLRNCNDKPNLNISSSYTIHKALTLEINAVRSLKNPSMNLMVSYLRRKRIRSRSRQHEGTRMRTGIRTHARARIRTRVTISSPANSSHRIHERTGSSNYATRTNSHKLSWVNVGRINSTNLDLIGTLWSNSTRKARTKTPITLRIVTNVVAPFIISRPSQNNKCISGDPCLRVFSSNKTTLGHIFNDFRNNNNSHQREYVVECCDGYSIKLLRRMSIDMDFSYVIYLSSDASYGSPTRIQSSTTGKSSTVWSGLVGQLTEDCADLAIGALSLTADRSRVIDFSDPMLMMSGHALLVADRDVETPAYAFLEPFDGWVWISIVATATVVAVAITLLEWNSPFGLNPWGRKRKSNYSLGSGLNMVYAILFQHTTKTKSPKSWPSKWLQNFWAGASIFFYSSYTANLAAFLAGRNSAATVTDIHDPQLLKGRRTLGYIPGNSASYYLRQVKPQLISRATPYPPNITLLDIVSMLKNNTLDGFVDDKPLLSYAKTRLDYDCGLRLLDAGFADDSYSIGLQKSSWLKVPIDHWITEYSRNGFLDDLKGIYFDRSVCDGKYLDGQKAMEFDQHAGLYILLTIGFGCCVVLLCIEYVTFKWMVPYWRKKPESSFYKSLSMIFWSQRLYRVIKSEVLISPQASAIEMLQVVRNREFTKLFQKSVKRQVARQIRQRNLFNIVEQAQWKQRREERLSQQMSFQDSLDSNSTSANQMNVPSYAAVSAVANIPSNVYTDCISTINECGDMMVHSKLGEVERKVAELPISYCSSPVITHSSPVITHTTPIITQTTPITIHSTPITVHSTSSINTHSAPQNISIYTKCSRPPLLRSHRTGDQHTNQHTNQHQNQHPNQYLSQHTNQHPNHHLIPHKLQPLNSSKLSDYSVEVYIPRNEESPMIDLRNRKLNNIGPRLTTDSECNTVDNYLDQDTCQCKNELVSDTCYATNERIKSMDDKVANAGKSFVKCKSKQNTKDSPLFNPEQFSKSEIIRMWKINEQKLEEKLKMTTKEKLELQRRLAFLLPETVT